MKLKVTYRDVINSGLWDTVCDMMGLESEGMVDYNKPIILDVQECVDHGISLSKLESMIDYIDNNSGQLEKI